MNRRSLLLGASLFPIVANGANAAGPEVVRIGWLRGPNDILLGRARGTMEAALAAHGARVEWAGPFAAAAPAVEAMNAGAIDITVGSSTSSIASFAAGVPMVIFAYQKMSAASEGIVVKQDSPIRSIRDLAGHSVAVNRGGTGEYLLVRALDRAGMDAATVKRVYLGPSDAGSAFSQGYVDGWATWDPFLAIAVRSYQARIVADGAAIGSDNAVTTMASRSFATQKPALLKLVFDTIESDNAWSQLHPVEAGTVWVQAMGVPLELAETIGRNNAVPTRAVTDADIGQIDNIADWYVANKIVPVRPDIAAGVVKLQ